MTLPFTSLFDRTDRRSLDKITNPFCNVEGWGGWDLAYFDDNTTGVSGVTNDDPSGQFLQPAKRLLHGWTTLAACSAPM